MRCVSTILAARDPGRVVAPAKVKVDGAANTAIKRGNVALAAFNALAGGLNALIDGGVIEAEVSQALVGAM